MIGRIQGVIVEKQAPLLLVDVNGVGYEVLAPMTTIFQLPPVGEKTTLHTHLVVREDAQLLYGFADQRDRSLFQALIKVNGVGPKLALTILSGIETDDFVRSVRNDDTAALVRLPGVGKKTAERLLVEMKDRLRDWQVDGRTVLNEVPAAAADDWVGEAESALVALGYKPAEASKAIAAVNDDSIDGSEALIRKALKNMVNQ